MYHWYFGQWHYPLCSPRHARDPILFVCKWGRLGRGPWLVEGERGRGRWRAKGGASVDGLGSDGIECLDFELRFIEVVRAQVVRQRILRLERAHRGNEFGPCDARKKIHSCRERAVES